MVPVYEGFSIQHAIHRMDVAGRDITQHLMRIIGERGVNLVTSAEQEICKHMKEKHCFVADDYERCLQEAETSSQHRKVYMVRIQAFLFVEFFSKM